MSEQFLNGTSAQCRLFSAIPLKVELRYDIQSKLCEKDVSEVQDEGEVFEGCVDDRARNAMQDILDTQRAAVKQDAVNANDLDEKYSLLGTLIRNVLWTKFRRS